MTDNHVHVVFDAYWWAEGPLSNRMVQRELILAWLRDHPADEVTVVVPRAAVAAARAELPPRVAVVGTRFRPHAVAAAIALPRVKRRRRADVVVAHNFTPLAGRSVTFIHDVLFRTNPEWFTLAERIYLAPIPILARRARVVVTSSRTEADRIERIVPWLGPIADIGIAVSPGLDTAVARRPAPVTRDNFVLTVSRLNVRKNLARTINAALGSGTVSPDRPFVVVGEPEGRAARLDARAAAARSNGSLVFLDRVDDAELAWLYAHADLFCYLSLDEGFGLPPIEAAHFGAPVLVSDIPVFRETMGRAGHFVDPLDEAAMSRAFVQLAGADRAARSTPPRAVGYSWSRSVGRLRALATTAAQRGGK